MIWPKIKIARYDFSVKIARTLGLPDELIEPISNQELGRKVETGFNKCLDSEKMSKEMKYRFMTLEESLELLKNQLKD